MKDVNKISSNQRRDLAMQKISDVISDFLNDILKRNLTKKEYRIIKTFYFSNSKKQEELAEEFGLTLRRLIQIKDGILAKLKNNSELVEFYKG